MKKFYVLFVITTILFSCKKDDANKVNGPAGSNDPNTIEYSGVADAEFLLWINGVEVNTTGLDVQDYVPSFYYEYYINPVDYHFTSFTFEEDSITLHNKFGDNFTAPYHFSNDSLFVPTEYNFDCFATGSTDALELERGYVYHTYYNAPGNYSLFTWVRNEYLTSEYIPYASLAGQDPMDAYADTFVIYNGKYLFH